MTEQTAQKLSLRRRIPSRVALTLSMNSTIAAGLMLIWTCQSHAQGSDVGNHISPIHFEVASIRQESDDCRKDTFQTTEDGILLTDKPIGLLIGGAFGVPVDRISGLPAWTKTVCYHIQAKVAESDVPRWKKISEDPKQYGRALQELLIERFALKTHSEIRERPVLWLIITKSGPKFHEAHPDDKYLEGYKNRDGTPSGPGVWIRPGQVVIQGDRIDKLVDLLNDNWLGRLGYPVENRTGLTGVYDIKMQWQPAEKGSDDPNSPLFTAMEEQLGLKLKAGKGSVETIVVDHVEPPSPN